MNKLVNSWLTALPLGVSYSEEADDEPNNDTNTAAADNELGYYKCDVCNVTSSSFSAHNVHIKAHDNTMIMIIIMDGNPSNFWVGFGFLQKSVKKNMDFSWIADS